jgi:hypothetical protein
VTRQKLTDSGPQRGAATGTPRGAGIRGEAVLDEDGALLRGWGESSPAADDQPAADRRGGNR